MKYETIIKTETIISTKNQNTQEKVDIVYILVCQLFDVDQLTTMFNDLKSISDVR